MFLKKMAGAILLAAMALPALGQEFPTASQLLQAAPKKVAIVPRYAVAFGKVLARIDKSGTTKFNYEKGRLVSEVLPNSVIGTYQYDRAGKFHGIAYNDGKTITVAYNADGSVLGLTTNTKARIKLKGSYKAAPNKLPLQAFLAIQQGVSTIQNNFCTGTDDDATCTIIVQESLPDNNEFGGGGFGWGAFEPFGGGGMNRPSAGPTYGTPAECQQYVCESAREGFDKICAVVARPGADSANCYSTSIEYYSNCSRSCENADWNWLNSFNFIWG